MYPPHNGFKRLRISPKVAARNANQNGSENPRELSHYHGNELYSAGARYDDTLRQPQAYQAPFVATENDQELLDEPVHPEQLHVIHDAPHLQYPCRLAPEPIIHDTPPPQHLPHDIDDHMPVDDSSHRIFITDLDAAIAEIEAEERAEAEKAQEVAFFLPDEVEKEISGVPQHVLQQTRQSPSTPRLDPIGSQALVLYRDPESISVSEEHDAVRKAVHEARQRLRERKEETAENRSTPTPAEPSEPTKFGYPLGRQNSSWDRGGTNTNDEGYDVDAMEIE